MFVLICRVSENDANVDSERLQFVSKDNGYLIDIRVARNESHHADVAYAYKYVFVSPCGDFLGLPNGQLPIAVLLACDQETNDTGNQK